MLSTQKLSLCHIFLITLSNILVIYPFTFFGVHTTWGALTYPVIFILTDLTTRLLGAQTARRVIFLSMFPGLFISYIVASAIETVTHSGGIHIFTLHLMPLRIASACFVAYLVGQLLDILVFQRYRRRSTWWLAPAASTTIGNLVDTGLFFFVAFYHCSNPFLNQHWPEIAMVDMGFKVLISLTAFVPIYGIVLNRLQAVPSKYLTPW